MPEHSVPGNRRDWALWVWPAQDLREPGTRPNAHRPNAHRRGARGVLGSWGFQQLLGSKQQLEERRESDLGLAIFQESEEQGAIPRDKPLQEFKILQ